ncbi:MAG TPA: hypothetical protein VND94_10260 [Terriglobia bacterium]|nr:hypothetical protein [Terriglobia bacterium]
MFSLRMTRICLGAVVAATALSARAGADDFTADFHRGCVNAAVASMEQNGVKADAAFQKKVNGYCDCGLAHIKGQFTASELMSLRGPNPDPAVMGRIKPIMQQCSQENFKQ